MIESNNRICEQFFTKVLKKGHKGLMEFEKYLEAIPKESHKKVTSFLHFFITKSVQPNLNVFQKCALIQIFESFIYVIKLNSNLEPNIPQIVGIILRFFNDPSEKVRLTSITSIYNIFTFLQDDCLIIFTRTFKQLPCVIIDPFPEVRRAAYHLNSTMKTLLNNAILDRCLFDINDFMSSLTENFILPHPIIKEFLIDWINTADEIREFQISVYLPLFLKKLFIFLIDENENVRNKAKQCLNGFIDSFRQFFMCSKDQLGLRIKEEDTENILFILIKIIEENIIFEVSSEIDIHVISWIESFVTFLKQQIQMNLRPFLRKTITNIFYPLIKIMLQALSFDEQKIKKKIANTHEILQSLYEYLELPEKIIEKFSIEVKGTLTESINPIKVQISLKWMLIICEHEVDCITNHIEEFINTIIAKLCENGGKYSCFIVLLENSVIVERYFPLFIRLLFKFIMFNKTHAENVLFTKILALPNPQQIFFIIIDTFISLPDEGNEEFKCKVADILFSLLVCTKNLSELREKIKQKVVQKETLYKLYDMFMYSKATIIGLCFLLRNFIEIESIIQSLTEEVVTSKRLKSFGKIANCLLSPGMYDIILTIEKDEVGYARKAYLSLIMLLPLNKYTTELNKKIILCDKFPQKGWKLDYRTQRDEEFWHIYEKKYGV